MDGSLLLGVLGSLPKAGRVVGQTLVSVLPGVMFGHMVLAESLAAVLALLVGLHRTSTVFTFFQNSSSLSKTLY